MQSIMKRRLIICTFLVSIGFVSVGTKLVKIQYFEREILESLGKRQLDKTIKIKTSRGNIHDNKGSILAINLKSPSLYADTSKIKDIFLTSKNLSPILEMPESIIQKRLLRLNSQIKLPGVF